MISETPGFRASTRGPGRGAHGARASRGGGRGERPARLVLGERRAGWLPAHGVFRRTVGHGLETSGAGWRLSARVHHGPWSKTAGPRLGLKAGIVTGPPGMASCEDAIRDRSAIRTATPRERAPREQQMQRHIVKVAQTVKNKMRTRVRREA